MIINSFEIPYGNIDKLNQRLDKLNRKAKKLLGIENCFTLDVSEKVELREVRINSSKKILIKYGEIYINAKIDLDQKIKLNDWHFFGTIEHFTKRNIIHLSPTYFNAHIPAEFKTVNPECNHCQTIRNRKDTYLIVNNNGQFKQVGKTCLTDFTGHKSAEAIVKFLHHVTDLTSKIADNDDYFGYGGSAYIEVANFLPHVAQSVIDCGWHSMTKVKNEGGISTRDDALNNYNDAKEPSQKALNLSEKALNWILSQSDKVDNMTPYMYKLYSIAEFGAMEYRNLGIVASLIGTYMREIEHKKLTEKLQVSVYVGELKERLNFNRLECISVKFWPCKYNGTKYANMFRDDDGNIFLWDTPTYDFSEDVGNFFSGKATIKKHKEFNGIKQTWLARCKFNNVN